jgi:hypothetical protein
VALQSLQLVLRLDSSHRRRKTILAVVHARRLKCSIRQLFRGTDENLDPRLQVSLVTRHEGDNGSTRRDDDLILTVLVFDRQRSGGRSFQARVHPCGGHTSARDLSQHPGMQSGAAIRARHLEAGSTHMARIADALDVQLISY